MTAAERLASHRREAVAREWARRIAPPGVILAVNIWICWRLFHTEYLDRLSSVEGVFISLARYIRDHWPMYDWLPLWYNGYPFPNAYRPLLHYTVAIASAITGASPALCYHFITGCTYSLGGVAFYFLAKSLIRSRIAAFCGGLLFSTLSPSLLMFSVVRADASGWYNARRLQALAVYGEGPNVTGLTLGIFALAALHRALERRTAVSAIAAAFAIALVPATSWPATVALMLAMFAYACAIAARDIRRTLPRLIAIGLIATGIVLPLALPSAIWPTFRNASIMSDVPTAGAERWIGFGVILVAMAAVRFALSRAPFPVRFAALYAIVTSGIVMAAGYVNVRLFPQAMRFHLVLEIGITLLAVTSAYALLQNRPRASRALIGTLLLSCGAQAWRYRHYARTIIQPLDIAKSVEYQEARWFDANARGARVEAPGTVSFWMNVFTDTPQLTGCCAEATPNFEDYIASYVTAAGFHSDEESADYTLLWMKAFALGDFATGGAASREHYHPFQFPYRFRGRLPLVWRNGDDFIYRIPERTPGVARIVRASDLIKQPPENGIDVKELRPFVQALDDSSLPLASAVWIDVNHLAVRSTMQPGEAASIAVSYDRGWSASANGKAAKLYADGLGLIVVEPDCSGECRIDLRWSAGAEPWISVAASMATLAGCFMWWRRSLRVQKKGIPVNG